MSARRLETRPFARARAAHTHTHTNERCVLAQGSVRRVCLHTILRPWIAPWARPPRVFFREEAMGPPQNLAGVRTEQTESSALSPTRRGRRLAPRITGGPRSSPPRDPQRLCGTVFFGFFVALARRRAARRRRRRRRFLSLNPAQFNNNHKHNNNNNNAITTATPAA